MANIPGSLLYSLFVVVVLAGCAAPQPMPFQLIDPESRIQKGTIFPENHRIEVTVDGHVFSGFYMVATGAAVSQTSGGVWFYPSNTMTTYYSNSARAYLTAENGQQLSCQFLIESAHALGECRTPAGMVYQLIANGAASKSK